MIRFVKYMNKYIISISIDVNEGGGGVGGLSLPKNY